MIRKAEKTDIEFLMIITKACAKAMIEKGIYQWNEHYPSKSAFENDLKRKELYILEVDSQVVGCIVISTLIG